MAERGAAEGLASRIGGECPNVLAAAPSEPSPGASSSFPRRVAEARREQEQLGDLEEALRTALGLTADQADRSAAQELIATVRPSHWSDAALERDVGMRLTELEQELSAPEPDVCADMRAWVASGYRTLSEATKALVNQLEARRAATQRLASAQSVGDLLARYEDAGDRAITKRSNQLAQQVVRALAPLEHASQQRKARVARFRGDGNLRRRRRSLEHQRVRRASRRGLIADGLLIWTRRERLAPPARRPGETRTRALRRGPQTGLNTSTGISRPWAVSS